MFNVDLGTMEITMHRGDTGAFKVSAARESETAWTSADRALFTVDKDGEVVIQRFYRLDTDLGNGIIEIQFHNSDTDTLDNGQYNTELRYIINPYWDGTAPVNDVTDALAVDDKIVDGDIVRTVIQSTLKIDDIYGEV